QTITVTDFAGNTATATVNYTIIVEAPQVAVDFSLVRKKDACPTDVIAPECTTTNYGNTTLTVGAADTIVTRFDWTNIGLGTFDQSVLTDQDNNPLSNTGFDQETGQTLILSLYLVSPDAPGTYQWSQTVTVTDLGGNTATSTVNYTIIVDCSILDDAPPVARCQDITVDLLPGETATITPQEVNDGSADGCGALAGGTLDLLSFTCADEGANLVTLTVHDLRNNTASCTATVTVAVIEDIYPGRADDCVAGTVPVNTGQAWQDIREPGGQLVAQVIIGGNNNIKNVGGSVFKTDSDLDNLNGTPFVSKRIDLTMLDGALNEVQPASEPVYVRLYYTEAELRALRNVVSGTPPSDFVVVKSDVTDCGPGYEGLNAVGMNATFTALDCNRGGYYEFFTGRFSTFYLFPSEAILPVELSSFTAHALPKQQAQLNWTTQTETGNSHFVVERSTDGHTFTHLGAVAGAGESSSEKWYTFQDENALAGVNYYRLRQVDFDGTESLSEVRVVTFAGGSDLTVYPNPATGELWLSDFTGGPISVMDAAGREVLSTRLAEGEALPVSHLAPGMYLLRAGEMVVGWVKR
ncbi:MAG: T9SS type A sorting domain-containing protein, partial [Bacteroidota bacterium]